MKDSWGGFLEYAGITIIQVIGLIAIYKTAWGNEHIWIVIIIAFAFNLIAFKSYCFIPRYKIPKKPETHPILQFQVNTIEMKDKSLFYSENMTKAKFEKGKVYCMAPNYNFYIGNYRIDGDRVYVDAKDDREIGNISLNNEKPNLIFLSNLGWYKHMGLTDYSRKPLTLLVAEIFNSNDNNVQIILDNKTNDVVAMYKGDSIGAAAAFVCMQYECSRSGKCHDFYYGD